MSWIFENFTAFIMDAVDGAIGWFGEMLNNLFVWMVETTLLNVYVINAEKFIVATAIALIPLMVMKINTEGYMLETNYDPEADPFNMLIRVAQAVALIVNNTWIFNWLFDMGKDFTKDLLGAADTTGFNDKTQKLLNAYTVPNTSAAWGIIMIGVVLISIIVFAIVSGLRAGELVAMFLFFPFFCIDLLTTAREYWGNFIRAYLMAFFSYAFQLLFYVIALKSYASATLGNARYFIATIVWMILAIRAPQFLEKYIYKSGVSNAAFGGIRMVAQTAIMRRAFR